MIAQEEMESAAEFVYDVLMNGPSITREEFLSTPKEELPAFKAISAMAGLFDLDEEDVRTVSTNQALRIITNIVKDNPGRAAAIRVAAASEGMEPIVLLKSLVGLGGMLYGLGMLAGQELARQQKIKEEDA